MIEKLVKRIIYYLLGLLIYSAVLYLTQNLILSILGINENDIIINYDGFHITFITYTILFIIIDVGLYIYDLKLIKRLNKNISTWKEQRNEEKICDSISLSYNGSSFAGSI